jgi:hypothetical protein
VAEIVNALEEIPLDRVTVVTPPGVGFRSRGAQVSPLASSRPVAAVVMVPPGHA